MVLKRKIDLNFEQIPTDEIENSPTFYPVTPIVAKHIRRQLSEQNFSKSIKHSHISQSVKR